jgi:hypothetical protein
MYLLLELQSPTPGLNSAVKSLLELALSGTSPTSRDSANDRFSKTAMPRKSARPVSQMFAARLGSPYICRQVRS